MILFLSALLSLIFAISIVLIPLRYGKHSNEFDDKLVDCNYKISKMRRLSDLYEVIIFTTVLRKTLINTFDGISYWEDLKRLLKSDWSASKWVVNDYFYCDYVMKLPDDDIMNHFMKQTVKIPLNNCPNFIKINQIAYNIGQYVALTNDIPKYSEFNDYIEEDMLLSEIMDEEDIIELKDFLFM